MKLVHFGAGKIGRGLIGELFAENNYDIYFIDNNHNLISQIKQNKEYDIKILDLLNEIKSVKVTNAYQLEKENSEIISLIAQADIVSSSVWPENLPKVAQIIAEGLKQRIKDQNFNALDIIAFENMIAGTEYLNSEIFKHLNNEEQEFCDRHFGFPNVAIDRIIPDSPFILNVEVERHKEVILERKNSKRAHLFPIKGVIYTDNIQSYVERKLFTVNTGHIAIAYSGKFYGYRTILQALSDDNISKFLENVLEESSRLLIKKWNFNEEEQKAYALKTIERFSNPYINDSIARVGQIPLTKLKSNERLIKPIRELKKMGESYQYLVDTVALLLLFESDYDEESKRLKELKAKFSFAEILKLVSQLDDDALIEEITLAVRKFQGIK